MPLRLAHTVASFFISGLTELGFYLSSAIWSKQGGAQVRGIEHTSYEHRILFAQNVQ